MKNISISIIYCNLLSIFLVGISITGIKIYNIRISDISMLFMIIFIFISSLKRKPLKPYPKNFISLFIFITIYSISWFPTQFSENKISPNLYTIPISIIFIFCLALFKNTKSLDKFLYLYSVYYIALCFLAFLYLKKNGAPPWLDQTVPSRFSSLSKNPNQVALFLISIPFISLYLYYSEKITKIKFVILIVSPVLINIIVIGKALMISWAAGFLVFFILIKKYFYIKVFLLIISPAIFLLYESLAYNYIIDLYSGNNYGSAENQGSFRILLWKNGLVAWLENPMLGNGPGHFSGSVSFEGMESHNLFIDWLSAYGILGFTLLFLVFKKIVQYPNIYTINTAIAIGFYTAITIQSAFHFYGRQPLFWMLLSIFFVIKSSQKVEYYFQLKKSLGGA